MKCWAYVFHFICIGCQRITVGKSLFVADFQHEVVSIVKQRGFVCEYCGENPDSGRVTGSILEAPPGEIKATPDIIIVSHALLNPAVAVGEKEMMQLVAVILVVMTFLVCCGEAYYERDFPRDTFKYFAISLIGSLFIFRIL